MVVTDSEETLSVLTTLSSGAAATAWPIRELQSIHRIEPLQDPRWPRFVATHPRASVFHSRPWLDALYRTYGYESFALTTSHADQDLESALVFCRIESWLTGRRLVSLPFSDHCEPLLHNGEDQRVFAAALKEEVRRERWRYIEMRPLTPFTFASPASGAQVNYRFHQLDLAPDLATLFNNFHKNSVQRKICRAQREGLIYEEGRTPAFLESFYRLFKRTRRRHRVPPPPKAWFRNLIACFGEALKIRVALKDGQAVAAMLTLSHKNTLVYKYGCSDSRFNKLGGMHLLFWNSIQEAKHSGLQTLDFGRTDAAQTGLITFKNRWGATQSDLVYSRYGVSGNSTHVFDLPLDNWKSRAAKRGLAQLPLGALSVLGNLLYRHVG